MAFSSLINYFKKHCSSKTLRGTEDSLCRAVQLSATLSQKTIWKS